MYICPVWHVMCVCAWVTVQARNCYLHQLSLVEMRKKKFSLKAPSIHYESALPSSRSVDQFSRFVWPYAIYNVIFAVFYWGSHLVSTDVSNSILLSAPVLLCEADVFSSGCQCASLRLCVCETERAISVFLLDGGISISWQLFVRDQFATCTSLRWMVSWSSIRNWCRNTLVCYRECCKWLDFGGI